jgi:hypothetical protein
MQYENEINMKLAEANSALKQNKIEYDKKHSTLDRQRWNADYNNRKQDMEHDLNKQKMNKDLEIKFELMDFELECKNLTEDVLKHRAFSNTQTALQGKKFKSRSNQMQPNDFMNNAAKSWFNMKQAVKQ